MPFVLRYIQALYLPVVFIINFELLTVYDQEIEDLTRMIISKGS